MRNKNRHPPLSWVQPKPRVDRAVAVLTWVAFAFALWALVTAWWAS